MSYIDHYLLPHSTVLSVYVERDSILLDPDYQRQGEVWSLEKKQLLIDSIINRYDIPKLYFHKLDRTAANKTKKTFAVVDGRQRLEAIFGFMDGDFSLSEDFEYIPEPDIKAEKFSYVDLAKKLPKLKQRLESFTLPITVIETDDVELIEEMFSRLNEAVPLNAAEKRNAIGGDMAKAFMTLSAHPFFKKSVRFADKRYKHREVSARLLFLEHSLQQHRLADTKKPLLDQLTKDFKAGKKKKVDELVDAVQPVLTAMANIFNSKDNLLASQSSIPVYYLLTREALKGNNMKSLTRNGLVRFNEQRVENRALAERSISKADFDLLEFDRMSQQGTNDASSIRERLRIIAKHLKIKVQTDF
jgi:uncharacterized protein with ParB-like and HNH nuclease domain